MSKENPPECLEILRKMLFDDEATAASIEFNMPILPIMATSFGITFHYFFILSTILATNSKGEFFTKGDAYFMDKFGFSKATPGNAFKELAKLGLINYVDETGEPTSERWSKNRKLVVTEDCLAKCFRESHDKEIDDEYEKQKRKLNKIKEPHIKKALNFLKREGITNIEFLNFENESLTEKQNNQIQGVADVIEKHYQIDNTIDLSWYDYSDTAVTIKDCIEYIKNKKTRK